MPLSAGGETAEVDWFTLAGDELREVVLRELEPLSRVTPFELAVVWVLRSGQLTARALMGTRATADLVGRTLRLPDAPAVLAEALAGGRRSPLVTLRKGAALELAGIPAEGWVVLPLVPESKPVGVLTLALTYAEPPTQSALDALELHGRVLTMAIHAATQTAALARLRSDGEERVSLLEIELRGGSDGVLDASLSSKMQDVTWRAREVAPTDTPVLLLGETGSGKEWLARAIHRWSGRAQHPYLKVNCAAITASILESELFGHVKGAFTGATRDRPGRFQIAHRGTLLLDEIGELHLELQAKLLRVLQDGTFFPVGGDRQLTVDVRILAATNVDLARALTEHTFREDLFYRLNVFPLTLPPLRERLEDLPQLCEILLSQQAFRTSRSGMRVTPQGLDKLRAYDWPGNLRELGNVLERATILSKARELGPEVLDLPARGPVAAEAARPLLPAPLQVLTLAGAQREHIERILALTHGRIYGEGGAAQLLDMKPTTLQSRMKRLGVRRATNGAGGVLDEAEGPSRGNGHPENN